MLPMQTRRITSRIELNEIAGEVLATLNKKKTATCITLSGDLGAGKTAFTKEISKQLGVREEVTSPTFVIMKSYAITQHSFLKSLVHIDAYRIESDDEMRVLGFDEILSDSSKLVCIEWPEKIADLIPVDATKVTFTLNIDGTRDINYCE